MKGTVMSKSILRHWICILLLVVCSLTAGKVTPVFADDRIYVIIASDQSFSMFTKYKEPSHNEMEITALSNVLSNYENQYCTPVSIEYLPWGGVRTNPTVDIELAAGVRGDLFTKALLLGSATQLRETIPELGIRTAVAELNKNTADYKVLVFITNGTPSTSFTDVLLASLIPDDVLVYTISIGDSDVKEYVEENILPASQAANSYQANQTIEFERIFNEIFTKIGTLQSACTG